MADESHWSRLQFSAAILSMLTVVWMLAPTFPMVWAPDPGTTTITWHSWADPLTLGYLILPPVVLLGVVVAAVAGWYGVVRRRAGWVPVVCCGIAVVLILMLYVIAGVHLATVVPAVAMAASGTLHALAARGRAAG